MDYQINESEARRFMGAVFGDKPHHFSYTLDRDKNADWFSVCGTLDECLPVLNRQSELGHAIHIPVNDIRGISKKAEDVLNILAIYAEDDNDGHTPPFEPSFKVESSPGHYHYWYVLQEPQPGSDGIFRNIQRFFVSQMGGDSNAKNLERELRLPGSWHRKDPNKPFQVRIVSESKNRYTIDDFLDVLVWETPEEHVTWSCDLADEEAEVLLKKSKEALKTLDPDCDRNRWISYGMGLKLIHKSDGFTVWDNWSKQGRKYSERVTRYQWESFCKTDGRVITYRSILEDASKLGYRDRVPDYRPPAEVNEDGEIVIPPIKLVGGQLPEVVRQAEQALIDADVRIYQRGRQLVRPVKLSGPDAKRETAVLTPVDYLWLKNTLTHIVPFQRYDSRKKEADRWVNVDCPIDVAQTLLAMAGSWRVPAIAGVSACPTMRPDGTVLISNGFDAQTGIYLDYTGGRLNIPEKPTLADAKAAVNTLLEPFEEFPFVLDCDRSVVLSAILTGLVRRTLPTAPAHFFDSPKAASGKSKLIAAISEILTGKPASMLSVETDRLENEKKIGAMLLQSVPIVSFDNLEVELTGSFIKTVLTERTTNVRVFHTQDQPAIATNALFLGSGNNVVLSDDLVRRVLMGQIDPGVERPEEREFRRDLRAWIPTNRQRMLEAGLTVLVAFYQAGRPKQKIKPFGSFEEWSDLVRSAIVWTGQADPCETQARLLANDPIKTQIGTVLELWHGHFVEPRTVNQLIAECPQTPLRDALLEIAPATRGSGVICPIRLGKWLKKYELRIESGFRIEQAGKDSHAKVTRWRVVRL